MGIAIETNYLGKSYPGKVALDNLNISVKENTIHGFLGPNGAGKSTTMNLLCCLIRPSNGTAKVLGKDIVTEPQEVQKLIGFLPEVVALYDEMTVLGFLRFRASLYLSSKKDIEFQVGKVVEKLGLEDVKSRMIEHLSKGFRQRVGIASALVFDPKVLILDEPASGLDPQAIKEMRDTIKSLKDDHTIFLSSHQLSEVGQVCDDITIINNGMAVLSDSYQKVMQHFSGSAQVEVLIEKRHSDNLGKLLGKYGDYQISYGEQYTELLISSEVDKDFRANICRDLIQADFNVVHLAKKEMSLEEVFIKTVSKEERV